MCIVHVAMPQTPAFNIDLRYGTDGGAQRNLIGMGASGAVTNARVALNANQDGIKDFGLSNEGFRI